MVKYVLSDEKRKELLEKIERTYKELDVPNRTCNNSLEIACGEHARAVLEKNKGLAKYRLSAVKFWENVVSRFGDKS